VFDSYRLPTHPLLMSTGCVWVLAATYLSVRRQKQRCITVVLFLLTFLPVNSLLTDIRSLSLVMRSLNSVSSKIAILALGIPIHIFFVNNDSIVV
jgi:hypothetical protein